MTEAVNGVAGISEAARTDQNPAAAKMGKEYEMFMKLLVAQMKNQDPLSPMDATEYVSQLATFSQVEQLTSVNAKLDGMSSVMVSGMARLDIGYIGKKVEAKISDFKADGNPVEFRYVTDGADSVQIVITDPDGNVVSETTGDASAGEQEFTWDSRNTSGDLVESGSYSIEVKGLDENGESVGSVVSMSGLVSEIITENGLSVLVYKNGTTVDSSDVVAIQNDDPSQVDGVEI